jgi:hypothetical protein
MKRSETRLTDAEVLRYAANLLRARSRKPNGIGMRVLYKMLEDQATKIDRENA